MLNTNTIAVLGMGKALPEKVLTNADLEKMVDTSDEWISSRTGIKERRICPEGMAASDLAVDAARQAMERSGSRPEDIDLVIVATITPDYTLPSVACLVQDRLGLSRAAAFDLKAACSGWVYSVSCAFGFIRSGFYKRILVIGSDLISRIMNWTDRSSCVLFGDGCGAAVIGEHAGEYGLIDFDMGSDGSGAGYLYIPEGGSRRPMTQEGLASYRNKIVMAGQEVFKFAVKIQSDTLNKLFHRNNITAQDVDLFIPHQANIRIIESAAKRLRIPMDKFFVNLDKYGNTSGASIPIALCEAWEQGRIKKGDLVAVCGFGAGLTWASGLMRWAY
ncbi:MAG: ketoacyl-ACP synthase III [Abditibacteriota bacterium]|nr:ketoacyl-ACP synthase III [Abditibacteriota bacterium]